MRDVRGIYCFVNRIDGKVYIGSSVHIHYRKRKHLETLRRNRHHNIFFQRAFHKHSEFSFEFLILELCGRAILQSREDWWMDVFNSRNSLHGYNLVRADRTEMTASTRQKISAGQKRSYENGRIPFNRGRRMSDESRAKLKESLRQAFENGRVSPMKGKSLSEAQKQHLSAINKGKRQPEKQRQQTSLRMKGNKYSLGHKHSPERIKARAKDNQTPVLQFTRLGVFLAEFPSQKDAAMCVEISPSQISKCVHGHRKRAAGYVWKFKSQEGVAA